MLRQVFRLRCSNSSKCSKAIHHRRSLPKRQLSTRNRKRRNFKALREELPELVKIAAGKEERPPELDTFAAAFAVAGENQEKVADEETRVLLQRFSGNPDIVKARVEFEHAQEAEERFHKDFEGLDFTSR
jgi:hypothetical protein